MSKVLWVVLAISVARPSMAGQTGGATLSEGRALFMTHCASCHGPAGRGDGPSAGEFIRRPSDLTQFAKQNGGLFNGAAMQRVIDGRTVKAHGTFEMPVWGDAFKWREGLSDAAIRARIEAIVTYVESIQERVGH
jgi:mono/diheme cytochrome c family protein